MMRRELLSTRYVVGDVNNSASECCNSGTQVGEMRSKCHVRERQCHAPPLTMDIYEATGSQDGPSNAIKP